MGDTDQTLYGPKNVSAMWTTFFREPPKFSGCKMGKKLRWGGNLQLSDNQRTEYSISLRHFCHFTCSNYSKFLSLHFSTSPLLASLLLLAS
jgi:hypothetical protein